MRFTTVQINALAVGILLGVVCLVAMWKNEAGIAAAALGAITALAIGWATYKTNGE